ncbi:hypothetical protein Shyhy01_73970 [Streptomyces hygroscopicus subsp. hygroscopicus]|nr:hypothetical protein Shyhy01_73970 [Streptomyces hygroscopicus subsp. hygroscopicus]
MTTAPTHPLAPFAELPPAPPGIVPYIAGYSLETTSVPKLLQDPVRGGLRFKGETPYDRDSFGVLWVRPTVVPKARRGRPLLKTTHSYRQRRVMRDMRCQVCTQPPAAQRARSSSSVTARPGRSGRGSERRAHRCACRAPGSPCSSAAR